MTTQVHKVSCSSQQPKDQAASQGEADEILHLVSAKQRGVGLQEAGFQGRRSTHRWVGRVFQGAERPGRRATIARPEVGWIEAVRRSGQQGPSRR